MHEGKSFLIISEDDSGWEKVSSRVVFVTTFREARITLLEKRFDYLVLDAVGDSDKDEIYNFIEGLRSHPRLSGLEVFVCIRAIENSDSNIIDSLGARSIEVISGSDYFIPDTILAIDETNGESLESLFLALKEDCAKTLARLKIELFQEPRDTHISKDTISKKFFDIFNEQIKK